MNDLLKIVLSLSLSGSLLILVLFFCKPFIKSKLSRQWQYYVWIIVVARLLLPFAPAGNLMDKTFEAIGETYKSAAIELAQASPIDDHIAAAITAEGASDFTENSIPAEHPPASHPIGEAFGLLAKNYWLIWLTAAAIMLIRKITIYQSFVRYIKAGMQPVSDIALLDRVTVIGKQINVNRAVEIGVNPLVSSPLLFGFFRPCIIIPSINLSERDFRYTVLHELMHYRRRDMFYKWLVQITICLHWFNPFVYLMGREINRACELACDEALLTKLGADTAQDYGNTLLESMASVGQYKEALASVTLSENKRLLKERLEAIINFRKPAKVTVIFSIMLTVVILLGATYTGAYAARMNDTVTNNSVANANKVQQGNTSSLVAVENGNANKVQPENTSSVIAVEHIDTITRNLIENNKQWDQISPFLPYMSSNNINKIIEMVTPYYPAPNVTAYLGNGEKSSASLSPAMLDAITLQLMQKTGNWNFVELWFPYMTSQGVEKVVNSYISKGHRRSEVDSAQPYIDRTENEMDDGAAIMIKQ